MIRCLSSSAALFVKVTQSILDGSASSRIAYAALSAKTSVFPVPTGACSTAHPLWNSTNAF